SISWPIAMHVGAQGVKRASRPTVRPFNPVAPAFANTLLDATGILLGQLPLSRDRVWLVVRDAGLTDRQVGDSWWNAPCQPTCCTLIASLTRTAPAARTSR
ncbi:hypothetical protein C3492_42220, partial [Streptomyces sp. Ru62]